MGKLKYWLGLSENSQFTAEDNYIFRVFYKGQSGGAGYPLVPKFFETDDIEAARKEMHAFVDERCDHYIHMKGLVKSCEEREKVDEVLRKIEPKPDWEIDSISIDGIVGDPRKPSSDMDQGLLDLGDLL
jgi:hypothetical protein